MTVLSCKSLCYQNKSIHIKIAAFTSVIPSQIQLVLTSSIPQEAIDFSLVLRIYYVCPDVVDTCFVSARIHQATSSSRCTRYLTLIVVVSSKIISLSFSFHITSVYGSIFFIRLENMKHQGTCIHKFQHRGPRHLNLDIGVYNYDFMFHCLLEKPSAY